MTVLADCIRLDQDCAQLCWLVAGFMSRGSEFVPDVCKLCAHLCDACAAECTRHRDMDHCRECAEACRSCAEECRRMAASSV